MLVVLIRLFGSLSCLFLMYSNTTDLTDSIISVFNIIIDRGGVGLDTNVSIRWIVNELSIKTDKSLMTALNDA